jgi:hypothetical protein
MKKTDFFKYSGLVLRLSILCAVIFCLSGCMQGQGKTSKEIDQRHMRKIDTGFKQMQDDIDMFLLMDRPLRLNEPVIR